MFGKNEGAAVSDFRKEQLKIEWLRVCKEKISEMISYKLPENQRNAKYRIEMRHAAQRIKAKSEVLYRLSEVFSLGAWILKTINAIGDEQGMFDCNVLAKAFWDEGYRRTEWNPNIKTDAELIAENLKGVENAGQ